MAFINYSNFFKTLLLIFIVFICNGCNSNFLLHPHGKIAIEESLLIFISFIMMLIVILPVIFMTFYFSLKYRSSNVNQIYKPNWSDSKKIEIVVWTVPIVIVSFLAFLAWNYSHQLEPKKSIASNYKPINIDVIALDWKWLFVYPEYHIATINEIMFPVNRPVIFRITSYSVMNSFFIPSLGSQIYAMPGMMTKLNLISDAPGEYKGISSNYSGRGFSGMKFTAITVLKNETFLKWIKKIKHSPQKLDAIKILRTIALPDENHPVEYFSNVREHLFDYIINIYNIKKFSILNTDNTNNISKNNVKVGK